MIFSAPPAATAGAQLGSKDGLGCADHDQPFTFGRRPRAIAPFPFTTRQFAHLLSLRGRVADGLAAADDLDGRGIAAARERAEGEPWSIAEIVAEDARDAVARTILLTAGVLPA